MNWQEFFDNNGDMAFRVRNHHADENIIPIEELYQAFKARLIHELRQNGQLNAPDL